MDQRQSWSSQFNYVLAVAGATIGFGCTWRFPYLVGQHGGGAYVLVFCVAMLLIGIPMILVESVIGRRLHRNVVDSFVGHPAWRVVGYMSLIGAFGIMAYYMVIGGWVLNYILQILLGNLNLSAAISQSQSSAFYQNSIVNAPVMIVFTTFLFVAVNYIILRKGAVGGIEHAAKVLMPMLFLLMLVMVVRNLTLDGAQEGVRFYLTPDFSKIDAKLFVDVLGQVFFALSLGFGVIITMSSYLDQSHNLIKISLITGVINTLVALLAGFMIFPSLFSFGVEPASGPSLVFKSLPIVFSHMPLGSVFAIIFFSLLMLAALTTSLPIYEVLITVFVEKTKMKRNTAIFFVLALIFLLGNVPSALASNVFKDVLIFSKNIFDAFDTISATIFFILTSLLCALYVGWQMKNEAKQELARGFLGDQRLIACWFAYIRYVIPFVILAVFISSFYDNFLA